MTDLARRRRRAEIMDRPDLAPELHAAALVDLARINRWSRSARVAFAPVAAIARRRPTGAPPLRLLDLACGGGDVALGLAARAARAGLPLEVAGCDVSPRAVTTARAAATQRPGGTAEFFVHDALEGPLPAGHDVLHASLFLHHLDRAEAIELLARMAAAAPHLVVQDLDRTRAGYALARVATRVLVRSPVVRHDGPASVEQAFTREEAAELARAAGLAGARVEPCFPCRWRLVWSAA